MKNEEGIERFRDELHWVSVLLRAAIGSLLLVAGISKLPGGVSGTVGYYATVFEGSLLPGWLVTVHASVILFVELGLGAWLISGYRLALAWKAAALVLLSLAVGMLFAKQFGVASDNYVYVALALGGLATHRFDRWVLAAAPRRAAGEQRLRELASP